LVDLDSKWFGRFETVYFAIVVFFRLGRYYSKTAAKLKRLSTSLLVAFWLAQKIKSGLHPVRNHRNAVNLIDRRVFHDSTGLNWHIFVLIALLSVFSALLGCKVRHLLAEISAPLQPAYLLPVDEESRRYDLQIGYKR